MLLENSCTCSEKRQYFTNDVVSYVGTWLLLWSLMSFKGITLLLSRSVCSLNF